MSQVVNSGLSRGEEKEQTGAETRQVYDGAYVIICILLFGKSAIIQFQTQLLPLLTSYNLRQ